MAAVFAMGVLIAAGSASTGIQSAPHTEADDEKPQLDVSIDRLSPSHLETGDTVELSGTVTNNNKHEWGNLQAYLVIAKSPFTSRSQLRTAVRENTPYTGERIVELSAIDDVGTLKAGDTTRFKLKVPWKHLGLTGADGVYPVGVQFLGTDVDGSRPNSAIGRATTFLPKRERNTNQTINMSLLWPFLLSDHRNHDGDWHNPQGQLDQIDTGGRLSRLLQMAENTSGESTVLLDPALLVALDDIAHRRNLPDNADIDESDAARAASFRDSIVDLARGSSLWIAGFGRPDIQAIAEHGELSGPLHSLVDSTTDAVVDRFKISGRRVTWPADGALTDSAAALVRGPGDQPLILSSRDLEGWASRVGSVVRAPTDQGPVPIVVDDGLFDQVPGGDSVVALRQWLGAQSALAVSAQAIDPDSKADVVAVVSPNWSPAGTGTSDDLRQAFALPWVNGVTLDSLLQAGSLNEVTLPDTLDSDNGPLPANLLRSVFDLAESSRQLAELTGTTPQRNAPSLALRARYTAVAGLSSLWRPDPKTATQVVDSAAERVRDEREKVTIEGPQSVTLSTAKGQFPLTIRNESSESITVGLRLEASNPAISPPRVKDVEIEAGKRHTYTVDLNLESQSSTSLTATLTTASGASFGSPAVFNVRSSNVGTIVWVTLAAAGAAVIVAMVRRFTHRQPRGRNR